ncbi:DUF6082 family protein [Streptomyces sp. NPDC059575]|uniref:DUF6082 family protein n=1 Tax=Streptomyces sp. NPDC059575 TaxID=3346872 RepID=UPI0036AFC9A1
MKIQHSVLVAAAAVGGGMDPDTYRRMLHANQLICGLSARFKVGLSNNDTLRVQARSIMARSIALDYWAKFGPLRKAEAGDPADHDFNAIMQAEFDAARSGQGTVA